MTDGVIRTVLLDAKIRKVCVLRLLMEEVLQEIQPSNLHQEWGLVPRSAGWVRQKEPLSQPPLLFTLDPLPGHLSDDGGRVSPGGGLAGVAQSAQGYLR